MIISIGGPSGSGKGTIGKIVAKRLGYKKYSVGDVRRMLAARMGVSIEEYDKLGDKDPAIDAQSDSYQKELGLKEDNFIIDSRVGFHFIPHSVKIFITASPEVRARRIFNDAARASQIKAPTMAEQLKLNASRDELNRKRYLRLYNIDAQDLKNYDFILDTTHEDDAEKNSDRIMEYLKSRKLI